MDHTLTFAHFIGNGNFAPGPITLNGKLYNVLTVLYTYYDKQKRKRIKKEKPRQKSKEKTAHAKLEEHFKSIYITIEVAKKKKNNNKIYVCRVEPHKMNILAQQQQQKKRDEKQTVKREKEIGNQKNFFM